VNIAQNAAMKWIKLKARTGSQTATLQQIREMLGLESELIVDFTMHVTMLLSKTLPQSLTSEEHPGVHVSHSIDSCPDAVDGRSYASHGGFGEAATLQQHKKGNSEQRYKV
jgi:hypothetical protein